MKKLAMILMYSMMYVSGVYADDSEHEGSATPSYTSPTNYDNDYSTDSHNTSGSYNTDSGNNNHDNDYSTDNHNVTGSYNTYNDGAKITNEGGKGGNAYGGDSNSRSSSSAQGGSALAGALAVSGNKNTTSSLSQGSQATGGSVRGINGNSSTFTNVSVRGSTYNQVRQTPFAYSPGMSSSFSQENCANSASVGVSAGFGAIGGGVPVESDGCNRRRDVQLWLATQQNRVACERMIQDEDNAKALKAAGLDCKRITAQEVVMVIAPSTQSTPASDRLKELYPNIK